MANIRWERDRARRSRLREMEKARRQRLVVILRDTSTGEERVVPYGPEMYSRLRYLAEFCEW